MLKTVLFILIAFVFVSCVSRTEYGRRRLVQMSRHHSIPDRRFHDLIDTSKLYEIVSAVSIADGMPLNSINKTYLKFYGDGRVGTFYAYRPEDITSLNPKRADIGYYQFNDKDLEVKTFFEHPQGGGWVKDRLVDGGKDTLWMASQGIISRYRTLDIPAKFLIYKPDW